jgi:hypothetical protein
MGLSADALLSWFLHRHLPISAPGAIRAVYRDTAIVTIYHDSQLIATYRDCAKTHANPDTDGNSLYHRAVSNNKVKISTFGFPHSK